MEIKNFTKAAVILTIKVGSAVATVTVQPECGNLDVLPDVQEGIAYVVSSDHPIPARDRLRYDIIVVGEGGVQMPDGVVVEAIPPA